MHHQHLSAESLVFDQWPLVLSAAGLAESYFSGRHGPCPFCAGQDRYRWSNRHGGRWVCNGCTDGRYQSGFAMLMRHMGYSQFAQAADHVRQHFGSGAGRVHSRGQVRMATQGRRLDATHNRDRMRRIWAQCGPLRAGDPVLRYLAARVPGLAFTPNNVRFHPALDYWTAPAGPDDRPTLLGRFPAMVALAVDVEGAVVQLHKTYLTLDCTKADVPVVKKLERGVGVNSFAVPLAPLRGNTLGIAEGLESALAASMVEGMPVWSCLNGPSMAGFAVPANLLDVVERVVIFADNDPKRSHRGADGTVHHRRAGSDYAERLAARVRAQGKRVTVIKASRVGHDMVDHWRQIYAAQKKGSVANTRSAQLVPGDACGMRRTTESEVAT